MDCISQRHLPLPHHSTCHCSEYELYPASRGYAHVDAVVVLAGVGLFAFVWWWAGARHYCTFPLRIELTDRYWTQNEYGSHCWTGGVE